MTQQWGPPNYPPPPPSPYRQGPQYQLPEPETDYYEPQGDSTGRRTLIFLAGSCLTLLLVGCCVIVLAIGWVVDERFGITTPKEDGTGLATPAAEAPAPFNEPLLTTPPQPGNQPELPGQNLPPAPLTPESPPAAEPAVIGQPVAAQDVATELTVFDIQRNVQPNNLAPAQGMEFVAVSVQLRSIQATPFAKAYDFENFQLQNAQNVFYQPDPDADNGRRLQSGELSDQSVTEGDLLFHIPLGEAPLFLVWHATGSAQSYTIILQ